MKKILVVLILISLCSIKTYESPLKIVAVPKNDLSINQKPNSKASFIITYQKIRAFEGYYSDTKNDKGGETYGGITRKYNKNWYGWRHINEYKRKFGKPKWNTKIEAAEFWVQDFYLDLWVKEGFDQIQSQLIAEYIFDFRINARGGPRVINETLLYFKQDVNNHNKIDEKTIQSLNKVDVNIFIKELKKRRIIYYKNIAQRDYTQKDFLGHWLHRTNSI